MSITLVEEVESGEIKEKLHNARMVEAIVLTAHVLLILFLDYVASANGMELLGLLLLLSFVINAIVLTRRVRKYRKLYKIALHNDMIRHDERLRFKERLRLEELYKKQNSKPVPPPRPKQKDVDASLQKIENKFDNKIK